MRTLYLFSLLSVVFLFSISCKNTRQEINSIPVNFSSDLAEVKYTGKVSGYQWNFKRKEAQRLTLISQAGFSHEGAEIIRPWKNELVGLNRRKAALYFIDDDLTVTHSWIKKGKSPGNNESILNFKYTGDNIYLYDFEQKALKQYSSNGDRLAFSYTLQAPRAVYRTCHIHDYTYLYVNPGDSLEGFDFVVVDSGRVRERYPILDAVGKKETLSYPYMVYDGDFVHSDDGRFVVYYCSYTGLFFCFEGQKASLSFVAKTIDETPAPEAGNIEIAPNTFRLQVSPNIDFFLDAAIHENKLFLLNSINPKHHYVVDIYNLQQKGVYEGSIAIPSSADYHPVSVAITNDFFYVLYNDQRIVKFTAEKLKI